jgi:cytochrome c5
MRPALVLALLVVVLAVSAAEAADRTIPMPLDDPYAMLKPGAGVDVTRQQCSLCHSTDYIVMQPRGDARQWDGVVTKMVKVFGAPLDEGEARAIVEYLAAQYGK